MLRGAMIVFSALYNICFLKRKIRIYQWASICCTVVALILVIVSSVMSTKNDTTAEPWEM